MLSIFRYVQFMFCVNLGLLNKLNGSMKSIADFFFPQFPKSALALWSGSACVFI